MKDKISDKIRRILAFFGVTMAVTLPSTACSNQKEVKDDNNSTISESLSENNGINKNEDGSYSMDKKEISKWRESLKYKISNEEYIVKNLSYEQMFEMLDKKIEQNNLSEDAANIYRLMFNQIYDNYDLWRNIDSGLPSKEEYLIKIIKYLDYAKKINVYESESEEGKKIREEGFPEGFTTTTNEVTVIYDKYYLDNAARILLHEMTHIDNKIDEIMASNEEEYYIAYIINEGRSNSRTTLCDSTNYGKHYF